MRRLSSASQTGGPTATLATLLLAAVGVMAFGGLSEAQGGPGVRARLRHDTNVVTTTTTNTTTSQSTPCPSLPRAGSAEICGAPFAYNVPPEGPDALSPPRSPGQDYSINYLPSRTGEFELRIYGNYVVSAPEPVPAGDRVIHDANPSSVADEARGVAGHELTRQFVVRFPEYCFEYRYQTSDSNGLKLVPCELTASVVGLTHRREGATASTLVSLPPGATIASPSVPPSSSGS